MLSEKGIGGEELLMLAPKTKGTEIQLAANIKEVRALLDAGLTALQTSLAKIT